MKINAFIPVRMSSSRFPGKPLTKLMNLTMLEHVWQRTKLSDVDETYIAVCDKETIDVCKKIGAKYIVTSKKHEMCMDRIAEAANKRKSEIIVTVQGDEPLIDANMVHKAIKPLVDDNKILCSNLVGKIKNIAEIKSVKKIISLLKKKSLIA